MKNIKKFYIMIFLIAFLVFSIAINLVSGSVSFTAKDLKEIIIDNREISTLEYNILYKIRIPRILSAMLFGGALSLSGYLLQTFFKNPIVGPYVLGISSGAKLFVGFFILTSISVNLFSIGPFITFAAAFVGSLLTMLLVLAFAKHTKDISSLIIIGIMVGYIASAGTNLMITFAEQEKITSITLWSMGSFSGVTWDMVKVSAFIVLPTSIAVFLFSKPLEGYLLGENYAKSMGINIKVLRVIIILFSSILSSCVTAFAGPISFVGIAVPHLVKSTMKTAKAKALIPCIFLLGASFCLISDYFARMLFSPTELNISTVTSFIGAPIVIWLMMKRRKRA